MGILVFTLYVWSYICCSDGSGFICLLKLVRLSRKDFYLLPLICVYCFVSFVHNGSEGEHTVEIGKYIKELLAEVVGFIQLKFVGSCDVRSIMNVGKLVGER